MNNLGKNNPPASGEVKQRIIARIRDEGLSVTDASRQSGYATKTIYGWLHKGVESTGTGTNLILENNRLKKELEPAWASPSYYDSVKKLAILEPVEPGWRQQMAKAICVDRTSYYRTPTAQKARDEQAIEQLRAAHVANPFYGVRRLRIVLEWGTKKTRRIRSLADVAALAHRSTRTRYASPVAEIPVPPNALKAYVQFINPDRPQAGQTYVAMAEESNAWVQDFTHVRCGRQWYYLAVILELASRQVVGWSVGAAHDTSLTLGALKYALGRHTPPPILHSDQGSEYLSYAHRDICAAYEITLSCSTKSSPWQNGFMDPHG